MEPRWKDHQEPWVWLLLAPAVHTALDMLRGRAGSLMLADTWWWGTCPDSLALHVESVFWLSRPPRASLFYSEGLFLNLITQLYCCTCQHTHTTTHTWPHTHDHTHTDTYLPASHQLEIQHLAPLSPADALFSPSPRSPVVSTNWLSWLLGSPCGNLLFTSESNGQNFVFITYLACFSLQWY